MYVDAMYRTQEMKEPHAEKISKYLPNLEVSIFSMKNRIVTLFW